MDSVNWIEFIDSVISRIINFTEVLYEFMFHEINILGITFSVWQLLGGGFLIILLSWWFIKKVFL